MSKDGEASMIMKAIQHGACDYLVKPIQKKELQNIWQHVYRKEMHELKGIEDEIPNGSELSDGDMISRKKRKKNDNKSNDRECGADSCSSVKKPRVVWNAELHEKFVKAVTRIGLDKVGPKKILDLMEVPGLTRENVASHLQKYRLYQSRAQKEKELKAAAAAACGGLKLKRNVCVERSVSMQRNIMINEKTTLPLPLPLPGNNIQQIDGAMPSDSRFSCFNQYFHLHNNNSESKMQAAAAHYTWSSGPPSHPFHNRSYSNALCVPPQCQWSPNLVEDNRSNVGSAQLEFNCYSSPPPPPPGEFYPQLQFGMNPQHQQQQFVNPLESYGYKNHQEVIGNLRSPSYDSENFSSEDLGITNQALYYASPQHLEYHTPDGTSGGGSN